MNFAPSDAALSGSRSAWSRWLAWIGIGAVFLALACRQHQFVNRYAVNVMFWDQWDFYAPLFREGSLWDIFNQQHGPHRQGIGFVLTAAIAHLSSWNSRADAFGVSFVLIAAAACALVLGKKCGARTWALVGVPVLFFNLRQYEMFVNASNISHGAMPVLLFMLLSLVWFVKPPLWRHSLIAVLTFLMIFTGFGIFAGVIVPVVVLAETIQSWRSKDRADALPGIGCLIAIGITWAVFAHGYRFDPAVDGYVFPCEKPVRYLYFLAGMLNNFHGLDTRPFALVYAGITFALALLALALWHGRRLLCFGVKSEPRSATIFCLAAFTLVYAFETAVGRVSLGWHEASVASRYVTLIIPGGLALLLHLASLRNTPLALTGALTYSVLVACGTLVLGPNDLASIQHYSEGRRAWRDAYLQVHDQARAGEISHFSVHPGNELGERLQFMEKHRLNLFSESTPR